MADTKLPELPEAYGGMLRMSGGVEDVFTAAQMREYATQAAIASEQAASQPVVQEQAPPLPKIGPVTYASANDIMLYRDSPIVGRHIPGYLDVALYTADQLRDRDAMWLAKIAAIRSAPPVSKECQPNDGKDAARYRYIESCGTGTIRLDFHPLAPSYINWNPNNPLGHSIDAAMSDKAPD